MGESEIWDERSANRKKIGAPVEFEIEAQSFTATSINISERGMRLSSSEPLPFHVNIKMPGGVERRRATLVWAKNDDDGSVHYGLRFID